MDNNILIAEELFARWTRGEMEVDTAEYDRTKALSDEKRQWRRLRRQIAPRHNRVWLAAAAGIALLAGLVAVLRPWRDEVIIKRSDNSTLAILILDDGRTIDLTADTVLHTAHGNISIAGGEVTYPEAATDAAVLNTVRIPRGETLAMTLSDGTRVHLNSESTLTYPVSFGAGERGVALSGQAWFDVVRDERRPFVVETEGMSVRVLGTEFDVAAYGAGEMPTATLYEGLVEVVSGEGSVVINPGTEASVGAEGITVREVPTGVRSPWREGMLILNEEDLLGVMHTLSRHYNVAIVAEHRRLGEYTFTGHIDLSDSLDDILTTLTRLGGPAFSIENQTVHIK